MLLSAQNLITILSALLVFTLFSAVFILIYRLISRERQLAEAEKKTIVHHQAIIDKANRQATEMLEKAAEGAEGIYLQSKGTNEHIAQNLDKVLQQMAEKHIKLLADEVVTFRKEYEAKIAQMQQGIDQNTKYVIQNTQYNLNKNLENFSKSMMEKTSASSQMLDEKTRDLLVQAESDIQNYKKAEIEKVDKAIMVLVQKTYQDLLGENIPPEINRDMILKALEKSKKEGLFDI